MRFTASGNLVDVISNEIYPARVVVVDGCIHSVTKTIEQYDNYILPGFIDAHIHIESSMLTPVEFARIAVVHGSIGAVCDPHEIANVLGMQGIDFMLNNAKLSPFRFYFGAPSCVPATKFETSGAVIDVKNIDALLKKNDIYFLSEMMNFPGVLTHDKDVYEKLEVAKKYNKPIDGHAPDLNGKDILKYASAGISTDHESSSVEEAEAKIKAGMYILIREGSAARNFDDLIPLLNKYPDKIMFCSDDKHPDELKNGHMNKLVHRAINMGYSLLEAVKACTLNPVKHYKLDCGLLQTGDKADFIVVDNLQNFNIRQTYIQGICVAQNGKTLLQSQQSETPNIFVASPVTETDIQQKAKPGKIKVIHAIDGSLFSPLLTCFPKTENGMLVSDLQKDLLKIVIINRYNLSKPQLGFVHGFGLNTGAIASSVAHDSHNIICVGTNDTSILNAIHTLMLYKGGIVVVSKDGVDALPLPIAGILSEQTGELVAEKYAALNKKAKDLGSKLKAPFMTLSFMALLVIPELKISDKGLFDVKKNNFTSLFE